MRKKDTEKKLEQPLPGGRKSFTQVFKRMFTYYKGSMGMLVFGIALSISSTVLATFVPRMLGNITTEIGLSVMDSRSMNFQLIYAIAKALLIIHLIDAVFSYFSARVLSRSLQDAMYRMRKDIQGKLSVLPLKYFDSKPYGDVLSTITNDVDTMSNTLQQTLSQLVKTIVQLIGVLIMMFVISPTLSLIVLISVPASALIAKVVVSRVQKYFIMQQQKIADVNAYTEEMYSGYFVTKLYSREKEKIEGFEEVSGELADVAFKAGFFSSLTGPLVRFVSNLGYVAVAIVGSLMVISKTGGLTIGDIQAFIGYTRRFTMPLNQMAGMASTFQQGAAAGNRIIDFLDEDEEEEDIAQFDGAFEFREVNFGYGKEPVIKDFNLQVKPGQTVAIVGPTGAGKTTLINLIMRFYAVDSGDIKIDGQSIYLMDKKTLRHNIGMVLQDAWLFEGTVSENIAYGNKHATQEQIETAADIAFADHFIRTLPRGYNTIIAEDGGGLSSGQRQLLTIARAVVADPSILILDEATSSVDTRTEVLLQQAMDNVMEGRTSFVIAHRLSTIKNADLILVLDEGNIVEQGSHSELLAREGFYATLYNSQFADTD